MILFQIAATSFIVNFVTSRMLSQAQSALIAAAMNGEKPTLPYTTMFVAKASYWLAIVTALAGIWTVV